MRSSLQSYVDASAPLPDTHWAWPLYGSGLEKLGRNGKPVRRPFPTYGPNELVIRHDALGLCYTDVKEVQQGSQHPRLPGRDLATNPIVPGHEASMTVVAVGRNLLDQYSVGDRLVLQPDVWYKGKSIPYCFGMDGAYRQYARIGKEILHGDAGNYLIPVPSGMTYAAVALAEPWACVEASYRMSYRTTLKNNGVAWFLGGKETRSGYKLHRIWDQDHTPAQVIATNVPVDLMQKLDGLAQRFGSKLLEREQGAVAASNLPFDDVLVLDGEATEVDAVSPLLSNGGVLSIARAAPMSDPIHMDLGRIHYDHIVYVGTTSTDLDAAYQRTPVRCSLKPKGTAWILGAGGPMGRMHLQRAIESSQGPRRIVATNRGLRRLDDLRDTFPDLASRHHVRLLAISPREEPSRYAELMTRVLNEGGADDIEVMAASTEAVVESSQYLATRGVINVFAGLKRGTLAPIDGWLIYGPRQARIVGHSGSSFDDQLAIVNRAQTGELQPQRAVAAIGGLLQIPDGIRAMMDKTYTGRIVVYPMVLDFPLTALHELSTVLPEAYEKLQGGRVWTAEAETVFLEAMLSD